MRKFLLIITLVIALPIAVFIAVQFLPDQKHSEGVIAWQTPESSVLDARQNLFHAMMGLDVAPDKDFLTEGIRRAEAINSTVSEFYHSGDTETEENSPVLYNYGAPDDLSVKEGVLDICDIDNWHCFPDSLEKQRHAEELLEVYDTLIKRYLNLYGFSEYVTTVEAYPSAPFYPPSLIRIHMLLEAKIGLTLLWGNRIDAIKMLQKDMGFARQLIAQADTFLVRITAESLLSRDLHLLARLLDQERILAASFDRIPALSGSEQSWRKITKREFRSHARSLLMSRDPQQWKELTANPLLKKILFSSRLFKTNRTINLLQKKYSNFAAMSEVPPKEFLAIRNAKPIRVSDFIDYLTNPIGALFVGTGTPDYGGYIEDTHNLNGLLTMVNFKIKTRQDGIGADAVEALVAMDSVEFRNPHTGKPIRWDRENQRLYFETSLENKRNTSLQMSM